MYLHMIEKVFLVELFFLNDASRLEPIKSP